MNRFVFASCLIFVIAGCAAPNEMRAGKPTLSYSSSRSAEEVAYCITDRWENPLWYGSLPIHMRKIPNGFTVMARNDAVGRVPMMVDVESTANGSRSLYYEQAISIGGGMYHEDVEDCQTGAPRRQKEVRVPTGGKY